MGIYPFGTKYAVMSNFDRYEKPSSYFFLLEENGAPNMGSADVFYMNYVIYPYGWNSERYRQRVWIRSLAHGGDLSYNASSHTWDYVNNYGTSSVLFADMHAKTMSATALALPTDNPSGVATTDNWNLNASAKIKIVLPN
jgi:hypothetical protein